jgi:PIN domain nuclease of toxin-antitoxin system
MLPIELAHIYALGDLPRHHRSPFDRRLITQGNVEAADLVTLGREIPKYPVKILW